MLFNELILNFTFYYFPIVLCVPTITFFVVFIWKYVKTHQKMFGYLSILFLATLIMHFFEESQFFSTTQQDAEFYFVLSQIFEMLMLYTLVVILEMFDRNVQFSRRQTILTVLTFLAIGGMITFPDVQTQTVEGRYLVSFSQFSPVLIFQLSFYVIAGVWLVILLHRSKKSATSRKQKKFILHFTIGIFLAISLPVLPLTYKEAVQAESITVYLNWNLIQSLFQNSGMLIIGIEFWRLSRYPWLLQRQKVHLLVVYSPNGIELFSKSFNPDIKSDDILLLAGGFKAVTTLIEAATNAPGEIKAILLEGKELRLINRESFICALLVEYTTQASELAHENFTADFEQKFNDHLNNFNGLTSVFEPAEEIALQYFS